MGFWTSYLLAGKAYTRFPSIPWRLPPLCAFSIAKHYAMLHNFFLFHQELFLTLWNHFPASRRLPAPFRYGFPLPCFPCSPHSPVFPVFPTPLFPCSGPTPIFKKKTRKVVMIYSKLSQNGRLCLFSSTVASSARFPLARILWAGYIANQFAQHATTLDLILTY